MMQIAQNWRLKAQRYTLTGEQCPSCGHHIFPPRDICPECAAEAKTLFQFSGKGEIYSYPMFWQLSNLMKAPCLPHN